MKKSECCGAEVKTLEAGAYVADESKLWEEQECQQCGGIYFEDKDEDFRDDEDAEWDDVTRSLEPN